MNTPLRTRFTAALAAARITYALLQVLAPLGGAAMAHPVDASVSVAR